MKLNTIPIPTKAAVSLVERLAMLANAPAETMGGMPDSNIETRTASPSRPANLQIDNAAIGALQLIYGVKSMYSMTTDPSSIVRLPFIVVDPEIAV